MNQEKTGLFIAQLRKEKAMTQRELAARLGITDKAVSKWERGLGCPDISLLNSLSEILGVTTSELLNGERHKTAAPEMDAMAETALQYAKVTNRKNYKNIKMIWGISISAAALIGILVCFICNMAIDGRLTWAWYPISSTLFAWLIILPVTAWNKKGIFLSLLLLTVCILPYLKILEVIIENDGLSIPMMPIGVPVTIISIVYIWVLYYLFAVRKVKLFTGLAVTFLLTLPVSFGINWFVARITGDSIFDIWDLTGSIISIIIACIFFILSAGSRSRKS